MSDKGIIFIVSAPSGAGKTTLCKGLIKSLEDISFSISHTTRKARRNEKNGVDYFFISNNEFEAMIKEGKFAEWANIYGNKYGTSFDEVEKRRKNKRDILIEIDPQGAKQLKEKYTEAIFVYILPPAMDDLAKRLKSRNTDDGEAFEVRVKKAKEEIKEMNWYDYIIINDIFENALEKLKAIVIAERLRRERVISSIRRIF